MVSDQNQNRKADEEYSDTEGSDSGESSQSEEHRSRSAGRSSGGGQKNQRQRERSLGGRSENSLRSRSRSGGDPRTVQGAEVGLGEVEAVHESAGMKGA